MIERLLKSKFNFKNWISLKKLFLLIILQLIPHSISFSQVDSTNISNPDSVIIEYDGNKLKFKKSYKRREKLILNYTQLSEDQKEKLLKPIVLNDKAIFGERLKKSGNLIRGITVGSNRDLNVNSGLRLQLSGKLSDDIDIVASITDESTPIQPEGNTETLDELDKVFIQINHPNANAVLGDYDYSLNEYSLLRVNKKLQGLTGVIRIGDNKANVSIGGAKGKYILQKFSGIDANQGPYKLTGANSENNIIIIAGSEKVYLDGILMVRGEANDYIIDYSSAEIIFTPKRMINSASRISVEYEYTDRSYQRNFYSATYEGSFLDNTIRLQLSVVRESDDKDNPLDFLLSEKDRKILENAGDNRELSSTSGVSIAEPDSLGIRNGSYIKIDSLINNSEYTFYRYQPGAFNAIYNLKFSYVGFGKGDYNKESIGKYIFNGEKKGSYTPIIYLPLPEQKQAAVFRIGYTANKDFNINLELSGSDYDKNLFSKVDNGDNFGHSYKASLNFRKDTLLISDKNYGAIAFSLNHRFINKNYTYFDRINDIEFDRAYNLQDLKNNEEKMTEIKLDYSPFKELTINNLYGQIDRGNSINSKRFYSSITNQSKLYLNLITDYNKSTIIEKDSRWLKQNGIVSYDFEKIKPGIDILYENKNERDILTDTLLFTSLKYEEFSPFVELVLFDFLSLTARSSFRNEYSPLKNKLEKQSEITTNSIQLNTVKSSQINSTLNVTLREKKYKDYYLDKGFSNNKSVLIYSQNKVNLLNGFSENDLYYQTSTELTSKYERIFVKVPYGTGNYIYLGDLNNNGISEENEFELNYYEGEYILVDYPTNQYTPTINLKTNLRFRLNFDKLFPRSNSFLANINTETSWRIEENTTHSNLSDIYLVKLNHFLNDSTTLSGNQIIQNDIYLYKNSSKASFRFRFIERRQLNNYNTGAERGFGSEKGIRIRLNLIKEINNQTDIVFTNDNLISQNSINRARQLSNQELTTDFSYKPVSFLEVGFKIKVGENKDSYYLTPTTIDLNSFSLRNTFFFTGIGRLRIELERTELVAKTNGNLIPFEMTKGNYIGKNYYFRINFDYRLGNNLQSLINYDARLQGTNKIIHTLKAEARAFF
ncbi:hypothetical protein APF79_07455 [bacterium BRH_c32]|nr:MAG: hypothetical protein APF79_07455 [bacterium BRH_c32]